MGQINIPGTSIQFVNPKQIDQTTNIDPLTGKAWKTSGADTFTFTYPNGVTGIGINGVSTSNQGVGTNLGSPQPGTFDATAPTANPSSLASSRHLSPRAEFKFRILAARLRIRRRSRVTLYILKAVPSGLIKIGISDQFDRRLSAIRRQNSESVELVRTYHGDGEYIRQLEKELHEELNAIRWQCEWFHGGSEVDYVVSRLDRDFSFIEAL
jgi:hypothetical protein